METLLIVDDEADLLSGLKRLLSPEFNCRVMTARGGREALSLVQAEPIDLVLSDVRMPDLDGLELLRQLHNDPSRPAVIMMTAYGSIDLAVKCLQEGAYDFVTKPLDPARLFHAIGNCLEHRRLKKKPRRSKPSSKLAPAPLSSSGRARRCGGCSTPSGASPASMSPC